MKLAGHANKLETNAKRTTEKFAIGNASVVIEIMRKRMYSHPIRTLVQEYMSNGRDATREIRSKERVIVSVPNAMSPVFKVRDFGPGITPERMSNVFILYGASTKRTTDNQNGGFGIGAKSAWAYTDSFTVVSVTGGVKRTYVAHIAENNEGSLDLLSEIKTDEPTGAEIQVAVNPCDLREFQKAIFRACYFWNDKEYPNFKGVTKEDVWPRKRGLLKLPSSKTVLELIPNNDLADYLGLETYGSRKSSAIIDGIPYPISDKIANNVPNLMKLTSGIKCHTLLHVGNGALEVAASREVLADSEQTREALNVLALQLQLEVNKYVKDQFDAAKTNEQWVRTYRDMRLSFNVDKFSKRGDYQITDGVIESPLFKDFDMFSCGPNMGRKARGGFKRDRVHSITLEQLAHVLYLDNPTESLVIQNRRIKEYLETPTGLGNRAILLIPKEKIEFIPAPPLKDGKPALDANNQPLLVPKTVITLSASTVTTIKVCNDLGYKNLTALPYTPIVRTPREKGADRSKEMFTIHECDKEGKHPRTKTLEMVEADSDIYLYVNYTDFEKYKTEFAKSYSFLASLGYQTCFLTDKSIAMVYKSKSFVQYETWKLKFKVTKEILGACFANKCENKGAMAILLHAKEKIKDKHLAKMLDTYEGIVENGVVAPPETIMNMVAKEIAEFEKDDALLTKLLKTSYPLINVLVQVDDYKISDLGPANELVHYINSKV